MSFRFYYMLILFAVSAGCWGCRKKQETIMPVYMPITESVYASGKIKSVDQYQVFPSVSGIVKNIYVSEGDRVRTGQPLLSVVNDEQLLRARNASLDAHFSDISANRDKLADAARQSSLAGDKMKNDSALYFRQKNLWAQQVGSLVDLEQRKLNYEDAKAKLYSARVAYSELKRQLLFTSRQSKNSLDIANTQAADFVIPGKINGLVYALYKKQGEQVSPQTPLALVGAYNNFLLEMEVDENDIVKVSPGQQVFVTMESYKARVFEAKVSKIYPVMNEESRTITVEAVFITPPARLYPNVSFEASIIISTKPRALLIPRNYLVNDSMVIKSGHDTVKVRTGLKDYRMVEINYGLSVNDKLLKP